MKKLILVLSFCLPFMVISQNWSPIRVNDTMNFKHSDSAFISHSIWVDSALYVDDDSIFYLNRIVKDVPGNPDIALRNQPQFLSLFITKQLNSIWVTSEPYGFMLKPTYPVGTQWDMWNGLQAEITQAFVEDVFGVQDSVKVISLSDGNEIRISKNFGLLKFPDFENGGNFELAGIQNTAFGESVPDFWDIYDFEVGDVFQYYNYRANMNGSATIENNTKKYTITSKAIEDSILYVDIYGIWQISGYGISGGSGFLYSYFFTETLEFSYSETPIVNSFNNQLVKVPGCYNYSNPDQSVYTRIMVGLDVNNRYFKRYGTFEPYPTYDINLYEPPSPNSDTIHKFEMLIFNGPEGMLGKKYKQGIGLTRSYWAYWEGDEKYLLEGYIKDGDTVGTITPDSLLIVHVKENKPVTPGISVFPNPAHTHITFDLQAITNGNSVTIQVIDLYGKIVKTAVHKEYPTYVMNVRNLKPGLYFYSIFQQQDILNRGKFMVQ